MKFIRGVVVALIFTLAQAAFGVDLIRPLTSPAIRTSISGIEVDHTLEESIAGGDVDVYVVRPGNTLVYWLELTQPGAGLEALVLDSNGNSVLQTHCEDNILCKGPLSWFAQTSHVYTIVISAKPAA